MSLPQPKSSPLGPVVFAATAAFCTAFFWWLLVYDHGVGKIAH